MQQDQQGIATGNFISDMRAVIDRHYEDAGRELNVMNRADGVIVPVTPSDQMWATFLAFHTAIVDWTIAQGIKDDKVKASVMIDIGLRMFLDATQSQIMQAEAQKPKPKKPAIYLQN